MDKQLELEAVSENIARAMDYIGELLDVRKVTSKEKARTILIAEETIVRMIEHADEDSTIVIEGHGFLGNIVLRLRSRGTSFDIDDIENHLLFDGGPDEDDEVNDVIHRLVDRVFWDRLSIRSNKGINRAQIQVAKSPYSGIVFTLVALVLGLLTGIVFRVFTSEAVSAGASTYVFTPVFTVFMNALKMMIGPLVFCSIASSIADFTDLRALGKIAAKVVCAYLITSAIAILIGYSVSFLFPEGNPNLIHAVGNQAADIVNTGKTTDTSILTTLVNIVPVDIIDPFLKSDMLQIIFMAVILGIVGATMSNRIPAVRNALSILNKVFSTIVSYMVKFVPFIVFCSMAKMMVTLDFNDFGDIFMWIPVNYLGCFLMIGVYCLILLVVGRVNPLLFLKKYFPAILTAFSTSSSNATLPASLACCDKLGVSRKVSSFSLPLGATINMDGSCITLVVTAFFMAGIYGVDLDSGMLVSLFISIMALSVGCPGIPGAGMVCMTMLFPQIGIPAEAVAIIMGLYPIVCMLQTATNVTGDAVVTTVISRQEKLLDIDRLHS